MLHTIFIHLALGFCFKYTLISSATRILRNLIRSFSTTNYHSKHRIIKREVILHQLSFFTLTPLIQISSCSIMLCEQGLIIDRSLYIRAASSPVMTHAGVSQGTA